MISEQNAFLTREMLYSNIWGGGEWSSDTGWNGTGWRAQALKRRDIGGKTGTTNDSKDAWYNGYAPGIVGVAWVGFDDHSRNLGKTAPNRNIEDDVSGAESGGKTALPAWVEFMSLALQDVPVQQKAVPNNIARVRIDRDTGLLTNKLDSSSMFEYFEAGTEPTEYVSEHVNESIYSTSSGEELF
ncbi:penicillin-binding protein 1A [Vibrio cholerae]|nr:penicillin-binding protein 1A [Vibrio cholerae]CSH98485.1 penicillin-binding protein 1A [Vibrio cholerae]CSI70983.1 penicillin-binding protein 1A [Vibrio cholerae]